MNTQTTEDYVSFEVAKLLKEKGFDEYCFAAYSKEIGDFITVGPIKNSDIVQEDKYIVTAPTIQMAMKWLRQKGICISIMYSAYPALNEIYWIPQIDSLTGVDIPDWFYQEYQSYEGACEAAIKYSLENLL